MLFICLVKHLPIDEIERVLDDEEQHKATKAFNKEYRKKVRRPVRLPNRKTVTPNINVKPQ